MTRKRFIKLLMSQGVQRNDAEKYAREEIKTIPDYEILYLCYPERFKEMFLKIWKERVERHNRSCYVDSSVYSFPELLRKEIQLSEESYIKNDFTKESEELKFKETLYRFYGEGEQSERN